MHLDADLRPHSMHYVGFLCTLTNAGLKPQFTVHKALNIHSGKYYIPGIPGQLPPLLTRQEHSTRYTQLLFFNPKFDIIST